MESILERALKTQDAAALLLLVEEAVNQAKFLEIKLAFSRKREATLRSPSWPAKKSVTI